MAGRYTDEERLARGQYKVNGQWYTSSGYRIRNASDGSESLAGDYTAYTAPKEQQAQSTAQGTADTQTEAAIALLQVQKQQAAEDTRQALQQAYISHVRALRDIDQQLSASGASGGMADSAYLALAADYENRRSDILADGADTAAQYDAKILDKRTAAAESAQTSADSGNARTGIGTAAKSTGRAAGSTAQSGTESSTAKSGAKTATKTVAKTAAKSGGARSYADLEKAYVNDKLQEVTDAMRSGRYTQGQARVIKNLLKKRISADMK